jgi:head decoration protein D
VNYSGTVASMQQIYHPVVDAAAHPPVFRTVEFDAGGSTYSAGEILAFDGDGYAVSYDPDAVDSTVNIVGVLAEPIDASGGEDVPAAMLWHGAVKRAELTVEGGAPAESDYGALENTGRIFLV